jgi:anthranilate phosphoribosyltransferase
MSPCFDLVPFPEPAWLAGHSEPVIDGLLDDLDDDEARRLYRAYLADEVRAPRLGAILPAWRAFDRAMCEILRRNTLGR